jgi:NADH dehydrogenase [ubiquinone] 1 alpha subcomplex assembly factor 2
MKQLAAEADERWKSVPRYIDGPERQQPTPAVAITDSNPTRAETKLGESSGIQDVSRDVASTGAKAARTKQRKENPWQRSQTGAPSENWQPDAWVPGVAERR